MFVLKSVKNIISSYRFFLYTLNIGLNPVYIIRHNQLHFLQKHARHSLIIDRNRSPTQKSTPSFIRYGPGATTVQLELRIISRSCYRSTGRARGGLSVRSSAAARTHTYIYMHSAV